MSHQVTVEYWPWAGVLSWLWALPGVLPGGLSLPSPPPEALWAGWFSGCCHGARCSPHPGS